LVCVSFLSRPRHLQILVRSDNEYFQSGYGNAEYFAELEAAYHDSSIVVPFTYNDPTEERNFVNGTVWIPASCEVGFLTTVYSHRAPLTFTGTLDFVLVVSRCPSDS
jgi:hypothetical protein